MTARAVLTAAPHRVAVDGQPPRPVLGWAGPWPIEERWWDPTGGRRRARLQVILDGTPDGTSDGTPDANPDSTSDGPGAVGDGRTALLLTCEKGRWRVEGVYD